MCECVCALVYDMQSSYHQNHEQQGNFIHIHFHIMESNRNAFALLSFSFLQKAHDDNGDEMVEILIATVFFSVATNKCMHRHTNTHIFTSIHFVLHRMDYFCVAEEVKKKVNQSAHFSKNWKWIHLSMAILNEYIKTKKKFQKKTGEKVCVYEYHSEIKCKVAMKSSLCAECVYIFLCVCEHNAKGNNNNFFLTNNNAKTNASESK